MQWGDLITLEYGKPIKDKESANGPIPVYGTNGQIGTSHLKPLCEHPSFILGRKGAYRGVHYSDTPFTENIGGETEKATVHRSQG